MRFAFILPIDEYYTPVWSGAIATVTRQLVAELSAEGHECRVYTPDDGHPVYTGHPVSRLAFGPAYSRSVAARKLGSALARARRLPRWDYASYWAAVHRSLDGSPGDVLVVANDPVTAARLARRYPSARVVLWLHNFLHEAAARALPTLPQEVLVVAVSEAVARTTALVSGGTCVPHVIHNGVDTDLFHPPRDDPPGRPLRVVCHGRIDPNKGQDAAAEAVAQLRAEGLDVELTVIGEPRTFGFDQASADEYASRVQDAVTSAGGRILGWVSHDELAAELRTYDIACALSRVHEPFGLAALEAMASGCAVIATDQGGLPEVVGSAGMIVPADSPTEVAAAIFALSDPARLRRVRRSCAERALIFTWSATAAGLLALVGDAQLPKDSHTRE